MGYTIGHFLLCTRGYVGRVSDAVDEPMAGQWLRQARISSPWLWLGLGCGGCGYHCRSAEPTLTLLPAQPLMISAHKVLRPRSQEGGSGVLLKAGQWQKTSSRGPLGRPWPRRWPRVGGRGSSGIYFRGHIAWISFRAFYKSSLLDTLLSKQISNC